MSIVIGKSNSLTSKLKKFGSLTDANQREICAKMNDRFGLKLLPGKIDLAKLTLGELEAFESLTQHYLDNV